MKFFPVFLRINKQPCLVVGGGEIAARKIRQLRRAGAAVSVVAPELCTELEEMKRGGLIEHLEAPFHPDCLQNQHLVIAATDDREINSLVSELAQAQQIPVNVVDVPELCSFITPSVVDRDPVQIAISTGGASPVLARLLRSRLETMIPSAYGRLATLMKDFREDVKKRYPDMQQRRRFWEEILQGPVSEMLFTGQDKSAIKALENHLQQDKSSVDNKGEVYLVGGGPGDPDLLTFRALRLMQQAEIVLYDRLVAPEIVDLCRKDADFIYVGKADKQHAATQEEINALLVEHARDGKRVLRLKGGDPFIFGRGGEEIESLMSEGISFQIVPGITAASGCASYAGIPLTHRDYAQSCTFVTGHFKDGELDLNWDALVQPGQTLAVYMGVRALRTLCNKLMQHGLDKATPAAIIQQGTRAKQRTYTGTLRSLPDIADASSIKPPSMIIIGEVVQLHEKLAWYDNYRSEI